MLALDEDCAAIAAFILVFIAIFLVTILQTLIHVSKLVLQETMRISLCFPQIHRMRDGATSSEFALRLCVGATGDTFTVLLSASVKCLRHTTSTAIQHTDRTMSPWSVIQLMLLDELIQLQTFDMCDSVDTQLVRDLVNGGLVSRKQVHPIATRWILDGPQTNYKSRLLHQFSFSLSTC